ncbi:TPA: hypothetical protein MIG99_16950 [Klebsiella pneumoniae]|nr:hypothetical protein [Klebsiella pneumoniae]
MHQVHGFACNEVARSSRVPPERARIRRGHATALKPTHKAGRRGGESTARQRTFAHLFSQPERVAVPRGFARVSVGDAGASEGLAGF